MRLKKLLFEGEILRLMSFTIITKPIALITQMLIANFFGAGTQLDAYTFSLFPINFCTGMVKRIYSAVAIPQTIKLRESLDGDEVHGYQNAMILLFYVPTALLFLALLFWGHLFVDLIGAQLPDETKAHAYRFVRFLAIPAFLMAVIGFASSILNLNKYFRLPAALLPLNAIITLAALLLLRERLGIWALPAALAISQVVQAPLVVYRVLQTRTLRLVRPRMNRGQVSELWNLSWMILVTQSLLLINGFVDKWFATGLESGSISSINYSMILMNFGQQIFSLSLVVVMFTRMSEYLASNDMRGCNGYVRSNLLRLSNLVVPVSLAMFTANHEIVRILFQRGAFDAADTLRTSDALGMYLLGLPALVINSVITKIFQSLQKLREKIILALQYVLTNVIGNMILVKTMAIMGLAISSSVAINLHLLLSLVVLYFFRNGLNIGQYSWIIARAYLMALIAWGVYHFTGLEAAITTGVSGDSLLWTLLRAVLKFSTVVGLYGLQIVVWMKFLRRRSPDPESGKD